MPNHASTAKRLRRDSKKRIANKSTISTLRTLVKKAKTDISDGEKLRLAQKAMDSAVSKGLVHKNTAARKVSRLMKQKNKES